MFTPDRCPSLGGSGLGVPRVPPPEPASPPTAPSPGRVQGSVRHLVDGSALYSGAGSLAPGCGGHCARCRVLSGAGGVCRFHPCGSRGWYGAQGLTPSPYPVGCPWWGNWAAALVGPREEPLEADSVALFCHPLPKPGVLPSLSLQAPRPCSSLLLSRPVVDVRSIPGSFWASTFKAGPPVPIACEGAACGGPLWFALPGGSRRSTGADSGSGWE